MKQRRPLIYAVDFDGTLCDSQFPDCGLPIIEVIDYCKDLVETGYQLILWTCRSGIPLEDAVEWCNNQGLIFDAVNENLPETIQFFGADPRKIFADYYIDDRNLSILEIQESRLDEWNKD